MELEHRLGRDSWVVVILLDRLRQSKEHLMRILVLRHIMLVEVVLKSLVILLLLRIAHGQKKIPKDRARKPLLIRDIVLKEFLVTALRIIVLLLLGVRSPHALRVNGVTWPRRVIAIRIVADHSLLAVACYALYRVDNSLLRD